MNFSDQAAYIQAAIEELEAYLLSEDLFWPINKPAPVASQTFPRLTIGGLRLALKHSAALAIDQKNRWLIDQFDQRVHVIQQKWRLRWEQKAHRELISRLMQWRNYLQELRQEPDRQAAYYPYEVRWRVMVTLLEQDLEELNPEETELRSGLDLMLSAQFVEGEFIWELPLRVNFPQNPYWFLYGLPRGKN
jgi:hypothetical protein